ncbi:hypothetical protein BOTBODRAFT_53934 [Botryobasidium botryosum FD-172 SS1]|uniref:F-box domain-containing protein n=1 Tax=Botryobasidium botryosum (strain FD-172 SS1) TaxID=930990 RepID=A0A067MLN1_BOTB1|nr:hypothetical protein BOTBODRAFT_53934 [Botryobasidium botryosum FD-172 SS1]
MDSTLRKPQDSPPPYTHIECHSVFQISEILSITLSYVSPPDLTKCLRVNKHWFPLAAAHLWERVSINTILSLTERGRDVLERRRVYEYTFPLSVSCARRTLIYTSFVTSITCPDPQDIIYHFKSILDLMHDFLHAWAILATTRPSLVTNAQSSHSPPVHYSDLHLNNLFPRLRYLRGVIAYRRGTCTFSFPYIPALGIVEPFRAVYSTSRPLVDTRKFLTMHAHSLTINMRVAEIGLFTLADKSLTLRELDVTVTSVDIAHLRGWAELDPLDDAEVEAGDLEDVQPRLTHFTLRSPQPLPLFLALLKVLPSLKHIADLHLQTLVYGGIPALLEVSDSDDLDTEDELVSTDFDSLDGGGSMMGLSDVEEEEGGFVSAGSGDDNESDGPGPGVTTQVWHTTSPLGLVQNDPDSDDSSRDGDASSLFSTASSASQHADALPLTSPQSLSQLTSTSTSTPALSSSPEDVPSEEILAPSTKTQAFRATLEDFVHLRWVRLSSITEEEDGTQGKEDGADFFGGKTRMLDSLVKAIESAGDDWVWDS